MAESARVPRIAVIGGGISGLAAAHRLLELAAAEDRRVDVRLFEASSRLGGVIATEQAGDCLIENGPDSFLSEKPWALALAQRVGLTDQLIGTREDLRRTYIVRGGKLHPLPEGFLLLAPTRFAPLVASSLFSWTAKMRMAMDLVLPRRKSGADESLQSFVERRLGRQVLERVAQPLVGGIYTADPARLSLLATMPRFAEMERQHRSVIWAMWQQQRKAAPAGTSGARWSLFVSFKRGMQVLVDQLGRRMPEGLFQLGKAVTALERRDDGYWSIGFDDPWDAVIVATPAPAAARIVQRTAPALAEELGAIAYASTAIVNLVYRREEIPHPLNGFGFVVPAIEGRAILACTFSSLKYEGRAPGEWVVVRAFVGGALQPHLVEQDDGRMETSVRAELRALLGITAEPRLRRIARWINAMPQYHVGHLDRRDRIAQLVGAIPGLALAGNAYQGVGIPDCVHSGEHAAEALFAAIRGRAQAST